MTKEPAQRKNPLGVYFHDRHFRETGGRCTGPGLHLNAKAEQVSYSDLGGGHDKPFFVFSLREDPMIRASGPGTSYRVLVARPSGVVDSTWMYVPNNFQEIKVTYPTDFIPSGDNGWSQHLRLGTYTILVKTADGRQAVCSGFNNQPRRP